MAVENTSNRLCPPDAVYSHNRTRTSPTVREDHRLCCSVRPRARRAASSTASGASVFRLRILLYHPHAIGAALPWPGSGVASVSVAGPDWAPSPRHLAVVVPHPRADHGPPSMSSRSPRRIRLKSRCHLPARDVGRSPPWPPPVGQYGVVVVAAAARKNVLGAPRIATQPLPLAGLSLACRCSPWPVADAELKSRPARHPACRARRAKAVARLPHCPRCVVHTTARNTVVPSTAGCGRGLLRAPDRPQAPQHATTTPHTTASGPGR